MTTSGSPWRQDITSPDVVYGNPPAPSGAATQVIPIGAPPASAGDPDLLPRNSVVEPVDISALFGALPPGSVMAFAPPMALGAFAGRAKHILSLVWTWDVQASVPFVADQYVVQLATIPVGVEPFSAIASDHLYLNDEGLSNARPVVKGGYEPPVYIPPEFTAVVFVQNSAPATDPTAGTRQRLYLQWRLV